MMARRHHNQSHQQQFRYLRTAALLRYLSLCGVDSTGLAVSLPILLLGLACHGRSSEHVWENEMSLLSGSHITGGILFVGMISNREPDRLQTKMQDSHWDVGIAESQEFRRSFQNPTQ